MRSELEVTPILGPRGQLVQDVETEWRKALAMNGDVLAWPEGGVSPKTLTGPGARPQEVSRVPRNACSHWTGMGPGLLIVFSVSQKGSLPSFPEAFKTGGLNRQPKVE